MKKFISVYCLFLTLSVFSLTSCLTTANTDNQSRKNLIERKIYQGSFKGKTLDLSEITFITNYPMVEQIDVDRYLTMVPLKEIQDTLYKRDGVILKNSLYVNGKINGKYSFKTEENKIMWNLTSNSGIKPESWCCVVMLGIDPENNNVKVGFNIVLFDENGQGAYTNFDTRKWDLPRLTANRDSAAVVYFSKHIVPSYIITNKGVECFSTYKKDNAAPKGGIYIDPDASVKFLATVNDPGVFMILNETTYYNQEINKVYEKGKSYEIKHKLIRKSLNKSDWTVDILMEEKTK